MALPGILGRLIGKQTVRVVPVPETVAIKRPHPLDHDGDGIKGGSVPKSKRKPKAAE